MIVSRIASSVIITAVRAYKVALSPLFQGCCRFTPSCSTYCIEAVQLHGPWKGSWLTLKRLVRCRPFGGHGYDPVPEKP